MEGGIRMDPVKGKLATLEILTHNAITPKNNIGVEYSYKNPHLCVGVQNPLSKPIYGVQKQFMHNQY